MMSMLTLMLLCHVDVNANVSLLVVYERTTHATTADTKAAVDVNVDVTQITIIE